MGTGRGWLWIAFSWEIDPGDIGIVVKGIGRSIPEILELWSRGFPSKYALLID